MSVKNKIRWCSKDRVRIRDLQMSVIQMSFKWLK